MSLADVERFREIIRSTGALNRAQGLSRGYIEEGKQALQIIRPDIAPVAFDFFEAIADYMAEREY